LHTLHHIAVEADSSEEAFDIVQTELESEGNFADWSDWHVVGGGRWSESQYADSPDEIISYEETPDKFMEALARSLKNRQEEMNHCLGSMDTDKFISDIVDFISEGGDQNHSPYSMNNYYIRKASEMLSEYYTSDSYFFDLGEPSIDGVYSTQSKYLRERLADPDKAKRQFLVPVDFHF
jgi:hypothetical protein